jgi:predicted nucleic acid-binding protein
MSAFVDSSVWFAAAAKRDAQNERAKSILQSIDQYLMTDLVLVETCHLLMARFGRRAGEVFWERLRDSGVRIEPVTRADLDAASEIAARFPDESFSFRPNEFCPYGAHGDHASSDLQPGLCSVPTPPRSEAALPDP